MADLDTRSKRASSVSLLGPAMLAPVFPDNALSQGDAQHIAWSYSGILATVATHVIPAILEDLTTLWCETYQPALHVAHAVGTAYDDLTLVEADQVHALGYDSEEDLNTAYAKYIDTEF